MSVDTDLAAKLVEDLDKIITDAKESLITGLPYEKYQQACGMIEAYQQLRHVLIPQALAEIQRR